MKFIIAVIFFLASLHSFAEEDLITQKITAYANSAALIIAKNHNAELIPGTVELSKKTILSAMQSFVGLTTYDLTFHINSKGHTIKKVSLRLTASKEPSQSRMEQLAWECLFHTEKLFDSFGTMYFVGVTNQNLCDKFIESEQLTLFQKNLEVIDSY